MSVLIKDGSSKNGSDQSNKSTKEDFKQKLFKNGTNSMKNKKKAVASTTKSKNQIEYSSVLTTTTSKGDKSGAKPKQFCTYLSC